MAKLAFATFPRATFPRVTFPRAALHITALLTLLASNAGALTVLERDIDVQIDGTPGPGTVHEKLSLRVRLDNDEDVAAWGVYRVALDEHRDLRRLEIRVFPPTAAPGDKPLVDHPRDRIERNAPGILHTSRYYEIAQIQGLVPGAVVEVDEEVEHRPYYPVSKVFLRGTAPTESFNVRISSPNGPLRWFLHGPDDGLEIQEENGELVIRGQNLDAAQTPPLAPGGGERLGVLHYSWDARNSWEAIGNWYAGLAERAPGANHQVAVVAQELLGQRPDQEDEQRVEVLSRFVQEKIRYVAVLVGEGGYAPSSPNEVLERRWGDCKDKAVLLVELLQASGIDAWPVLIHSGGTSRAASRFPTPEAFNHAVVAWSDPRRETEYRFVDPTLSFGGAAWLHPATQGQDALIVRQGASQLVRVPVLSDDESRKIEIDGTVNDAGDFAGRAALVLRGELAYRMIGQLRQEPQRREELAGSLLAGLLSGAELGEPRVEAMEVGVPELRVEAPLQWAALVQGNAGKRSLALPSMRAAPDPELLEDRKMTVALPARTASTHWQLQLPTSWCPPVPRYEEIDNAVARFRQEVAHDGNILTVDRRTAILQRWVEPPGLAALAEVALAEHRAYRRRIRLRCE